MLGHMERLRRRGFGVCLREFSNRSGPPTTAPSEVVLIGEPDDCEDAHSGMIKVLRRGRFAYAKNETVVANEDVTVFCHVDDHTLGGRGYRLL